MTQKIWLRPLTLITLIPAAALAAGAAYFLLALPGAAPPTNKTVEATPELIERGRYLAEHVALCIDCHSERDFSRFSAPVVLETIGAGGQRFDESVGVPGLVYSRNITPAAIGDWTDGELERAITSGVSRDGSPLFPLMPYPSFSELCERDVDALITWVRGLEPIENEVPDRELSFPLNLLVRTMPKPRGEPPPCPEPGTVSYGQYLVNTASCRDCHTQTKDGAPVANMELAGGVTFVLPTGVVRSANLTPDRETGLGLWSRERFIGRFKAHEDPSAAVQLEPGDPQTIMPWGQLAGMSEQDLGAIYEYLRTIPPVHNQVTKYDEPLATLD